MSLTISVAKSQKDLKHIKQLFIEYQEWLDVDLCFEGFQEELKALSDKYDCLLLARWNGVVCGGVGISPTERKTACEVKRLYVRDAYKGKGIGRALAEEIIKKAALLNYKFMCLYTLERLQLAIGLYENLGFRSCPPYNDELLDQVVYMEKTL